MVGKRAHPRLPNPSLLHRRVRNIDGLSVEALLGDGVPRHALVQFEATSNYSFE